MTKNPEIGNKSVWVLPSIWRAGWVRRTEFGMDALNEMLLNAAKCQGYSFYCFSVIKGKPTGGKVTTPPRLGLMPLTIVTKSSILDVWLGSKNATKSFSKSFCECNIFGFSSDLVKYFFRNIFGFSSDLVKYVFSFTLIFISFNIQNRSSSFVVQDLFLYKWIFT